jgi:hypothetical protein
MREVPPPVKYLASERFTALPSRRVYRFWA